MKETVAPSTARARAARLPRTEGAVPRRTPRARGRSARRSAPRAKLCAGRALRAARPSQLDFIDGPGLAGQLQHVRLIALFNETALTAVGVVPLVVQPPLAGMNLRAIRRRQLGG